jgi:hypothetical protein
VAAAGLSGATYTSAMTGVRKASAPRAPPPNAMLPRRRLGVGELIGAPGAPPPPTLAPPPTAPPPLALSPAETPVSDYIIINN